MLATRKAYTGGNLADVFKHMVCGRVMHQMSATSRQPWSFTEFWSGPGQHALRLPNAPAATLGSHRFGVSKVWDAARAAAELGEEPTHADYWLDWYVKVLAETNLRYREELRAASPDGRLPAEVEAADARGELLVAPSMAQVARFFMGAGDQASFVESEADEFKVLEEVTRGERRMNAMHADPLSAMPALVPPVSRRGLVFLDPPLGKRHEETSNQMVRELAQRFPQGTFCMFYQINDPNSGNLAQYRSFRQAGFKQLWGVEWRFAEGGVNATDAHTGTSTIGCGMVIANLPGSPTEVMDDLESIVQSLAARLDDSGDPSAVKIHDLCTMEYSTDNRAIDMWHEGVRWGTSPALFGLEQEMPRARWFDAVNAAERKQVQEDAAAWLHSRGALESLPAASQKYGAFIEQQEQAREAHQWLDHEMPEGYVLPENPQQWPEWMRPPLRQKAKPTFRSQRERLAAKQGGAEAAPAGVQAEDATAGSWKGMVKKYQWKHAQLMRMRKQDLKGEVKDEIKRELKAPRPKVKGVK